MVPGHHRRHRRPSRAPPRRAPERADHDGVDVRRHRRPGVRPLRQPDVVRLRGGPRRPRGRALPGLRLRSRDRGHRARPGRAGRRSRGPAACLQRDRHAAGRPRGPRSAVCTARRHHRHRRGGEGLRRRGSRVDRVAHQPGPRDRRDRDHRGRGARRRRLRRRRQHVRHPATAAPAHDGRRPRRPLGHEVPLRPRRRDARRARHHRRAAVRRAEGQARPGGRHPGNVGVLARSTRPADPPPAGRPGREQRHRARSATRRAPCRRRGPLPRLRRHRVRRPRRRRRCRRPRHPVDLAVGARDLARRGRVDARATAPVEDRARHDPGGPGPPQRRRRGRRGPLGRSRRRRWTAVLD